jgi:phenylacetic acid degradation operon negative regulatory protein
LFGNNILPRGETVRTKDMLYLLGLLGISEQAVHTALSRMRQKGWVLSQKEGRLSRYSLPPKGWALIEEGTKRILEPAFTDWEGYGT